MDKPKSWADSLLGISITLLMSAVLLSWAVGLLRPLLPVLGIVLVTGFVIRLAMARRNQW